MNQEGRITHLLKDFNLRKTNCRVSVLEAFLANNHALSQRDLKKLVNSNYDRVTIYRTIQTFEEKGILHRVGATDGLTEYALCNHDSDGNKHNDDHIHFSCRICKNTFCVPEAAIPKIELPEIYEIEQIEFSVKGVCPKCKSS